MDVLFVGSDGQPRLYKALGTAPKDFGKERVKPRHCAGNRGELSRSGAFQLRGKSLTNDRTRRTVTLSVHVACMNTQVCIRAGLTLDIFALEGINFDIHISPYDPRLMACRILNDTSKR